MFNKKITGHILALLTVIVWGGTFISSKALLEGGFSAVEILVMRFLIGYITLWILLPMRLPYQGIRRELLMAAAGLTGMTIYYLAENIAVDYASPALVSILVCTAPFFCGIFAGIIMKEKLTKGFFTGFVIAIAGVAMVSLEGSSEGVNLGLLGSVLSMLAAVMWGIYLVIMQRVNSGGGNVIIITRRVFFYGLIFMIPAIFLGDFNLDIKAMFSGIMLWHMLFLGVVASALCFFTWNKILKVIGTMKASAYIYLVPLITMILSKIIRPNDKITIVTLIGSILILTGLVLSEYDGKRMQ
ncbi:MAG: DMT family transporter [Bacillota bacterium]|nr:DMT family transporter [Bacillota bacterium]